MQAVSANPVLSALARRAADETVVVSFDYSLTAGQLLTCISELSDALKQMGIDRLGLLAGNSAAWVVADLACQSAGICMLPLPVFFADTQVLHSIESAGVDAVLTDDPERLHNLPGTDRSTPEPAAWFGLSLLRVKAPSRPEMPAGTQKITFTSGSTGAPKGVCLSAGQQIKVAEALDTALQLDRPRHLCLLPLSTLLENIGGIYYPLLADGAILLPPESETGFSGSTGLDIVAMLQAISGHQPTSIILLPQMLVGLVAALQAGWQPPASLKFAAVGGAKVAPDLLAAAREYGLPVYEGYGLSETASVACLNHPGSDRIGSVGRPLGHIELVIEGGEVFFSGNSFLGYLGQPHSWGQPRVATGDLGDLDADGFMHLQGRSKNLLISSFGRNISPEWVESEILLYPEISQCIVVGDSRPYCAALIAAAGAQVPNSLIQNFLDAVNEKLPDYARIKRWYRLPRALRHSDGLFTENGRPRRKQISERFATEIESLYATAAVDMPLSSDSGSTLKRMSM